MKLLDKKEMSRWAYWKCYKGDDIKEIRSLITDSYWAYGYCLNIRDDSEVRKYITNLSYLDTLRRKRKYDNSDETNK